MQAPYGLPGDYLFSTYNLSFLQKLDFKGLRSSFVNTYFEGFDC